MCSSAVSLNRAKIRDVLSYRSEPWPGVSGDIPLSVALDDAGDVFLARRENGRWNVRVWSTTPVERLTWACSWPTPSWGSMCNEGIKTMLTTPHELIFPALFISITVLAFNLLGDGLRDALDARMRSME